MKSKEEIGVFAEKQYLKRIDDFQKTDFKDGVFVGYTQCQKDMADKKYTAGDIREAIKYVRNTYSSELLGTPFLLIGDVAELIKITTGKEVDWRLLINK